MKRRSMMIGGAALVAAGFAFALPTGSATASPKVGSPAPDFVGVDVDGKQVKLSDYRGKTVVLEWYNHQCPFVRKHYDSANMQGLQKSAASDGIVWLTIVSSAQGEQGWLPPAEAKKLMATEKSAPAAKIVDPSGKIGKTFDARVTPHMYVIDAKGTLAYMGAIDDKPSTRVDDVPKARSYVKDALAAVKAGKAMDPAVTRAYGCTVKYGS